MWHLSWIYFLNWFIYICSEHVKYKIIKWYKMKLLNRIRHGFSNKKTSLVRWASSVTCASQTWQLCQFVYQQVVWLWQREAHLSMCFLTMAKRSICVWLFFYSLDTFLWESPWMDPPEERSSTLWLLMADNRVLMNKPTVCEHLNKNMKNLRT